MQKVALTDINAWDVTWPVAAGLGLGVGARLLRHGVDLKSKKGVRAPRNTSALESAQIEVPVDVSDEEAAELATKGIKVGADRSVLPAAVATDSTVMPSKRGVTMSPAAKPAVPAAAKVGAEGLTSTVLQGALGAGAAYGGWSVLDNMLDKQRLEKAKGSLTRSRERVKRLIAGEPDPSEAGIASALKTAEELYLKRASLGTSIGSSIIGGATDIMAPIGIPLGIGAALLGAKAYGESKSANKYRQRIKQISDSLEHEDPMAPVAVLHPVRRRKAAPSDTGVIHNPGAEPVASPELDAEVKVAARRDDDEDTDYGKWIALAIAGVAGAAGLMWVRSNPDIAKQYAPWASTAIDWVAGGKEPTAEMKAAANAKVQEAGGAKPAEQAAGQQVAANPGAAAAVAKPANTQAAPVLPPPPRPGVLEGMAPKDRAATERNRAKAVAAATSPMTAVHRTVNSQLTPEITPPAAPAPPAPAVLPTEPVAAAPPVKPPAPAPVVPPSPPKSV